MIFSSQISHTNLIPVLSKHGIKVIITVKLYGDHFSESSAVKLPKPSFSVALGAHIVSLQGAWM